jgi:hypothetical protein
LESRTNLPDLNEFLERSVAKDRIFSAGYIALLSALSSRSTLPEPKLSMRAGLGSFS